MKALDFSFFKSDYRPISISALLLGPNINFYLNDIVQYVYGGGSLSAFIYIVLAVFGINAYPLLFKKKRGTLVFVIILFTALSLFFSYVIHPSIGSFILSDDFNPLDSTSLFLFFYGFPLLILCSSKIDWDLLLKYLWIFSLAVIPLAALDYFWVMLRFVGGDEVNYMTYSYNQLLAGSICAVYGYRYKRILPFSLSIVSLLLIFMGGARGTLLCMFLLYFILILHPVSLKKMIITTFLFLAFVLVGPLIINKTLGVLGEMVSNIGGFSRTLYMITEGDLFDADGRDEIGTIIIKAINENPLGYGLLGDRYILQQHRSTGYAHNIILELICDYGIFIGVALVIVLIYSILRMLLKGGKKEYMYCFIPFVPAGFLMLFLSGSFLQSFVFWALLGMLVNPTLVRHKYSYSKNQNC